MNIFSYFSAVRCPGLSRPQDGGVVPATCTSGNREFGQRCVVYCKHGYKLSGPATKYCQADKSWSNNAPNECVKSKHFYLIVSRKQKDDGANDPVK